MEVPTRWCPPNVINWFINPINYRYITNINHSYWSYVCQLSYRTGAPPCTILNSHEIHGIFGKIYRKSMAAPGPRPESERKVPGSMGLIIWIFLVGKTINHPDFNVSGWWFGTFCIFPYIRNNHPS